MPSREARPDEGTKVAILKVVLVCHLPPPYMGQAIIMREVASSQYRNVQLTHVQMKFSRSIAEIGKFGIRKIIQLAALIFRIAVARVKSRATVLYYTPAGPHKIPMYRDLAVLLTTRWMFRKTIFHFHEGGLSTLYATLNRVTRAIFRLAYYSADIGIRLDPHTPDDAGALKARLTLVVPNGLPDLARNCNPPAQSPRLADTILFVGAVRETKGVMVLLRACALLRGRFPSMRVDLVGAFESAQFEAVVRNFVSEMGLQSVVRYRGELLGADKAEAFATATLFCLPSYAEAFPLVAIEAMQFRLPLVGTRSGGLETLVQHARNGFLVPVGDHAQLSEALAHLLADKSLARRMGDESRQLYDSLYTIEMFRASLQRVFDAVR